MKHGRIFAYILRNVSNTLVNCTTKIRCLYYFFVDTISAYAGFYQIVALSTRHLGLDDPSYLKIKGLWSWWPVVG